MCKIIIIAPFGGIKDRVRAQKIASVAVKEGHDVGFAGWNRTPLKNRPVKNDTFDPNVKERTILIGGGHNTRLARFMYPIWMLVVFIRGLFISNSSVAWGIGFETCFPLVLAKKIRGFKVIFDDADRFSQVYPFKNRLKLIVQKFERWTYNRVDVHLIPNRHRYPDVSVGKNIFELMNTPNVLSVEKAKQLEVKTNFRLDKKIIYINGMLTETRGADVLIELKNEMRQRENRNINFIIAGFVNDSSIREELEGENWHFLGRLDQVEALALYRYADFVFTYYRPDIEINKYAESNKWGDAIMMGCGVIVNAEVLTSERLMENEVGVSFAYYDVKSLCDFIETYDQNIVTRYKNNASKLSREMRYFDHGIVELLNQVCPC